MELALWLTGALGTVCLALVLYLRYLQRRAEKAAVLEHENQQLKDRQAASDKVVDIFSRPRGSKPDIIDRL